MSPSQKKREVDDEKDKHPFYSDWGDRQRKKRLKEIEKEAASWGKRKRVKGDEEVSFDTDNVGIHSTPQGDDTDD